MLISRRGQTSDAVSWIVATLIIVGILLVFIFIASSLGKANDALKTARGVFSEEENPTLVDFKNEEAFRIDSRNENEIVGWLDEKKS